MNISMAERNNEIFVDSNYFIALANENDSLHAQALAASRNIENSAVQMHISNLVFLEVVTVLSQKRNRDVANTTGQYMLSDPRISFLHIDEQLHDRSWNVFQRIPQKNVGFIDCSIVAAMEELAVSTLLTFDQKDFRQLQRDYRFSFYE